MATAGGRVGVRVSVSEGAGGMVRVEAVVAEGVLRPGVVVAGAMAAVDKSVVVTMGMGVGRLVAQPATRVVSKAIRQNSLRTWPVKFIFSFNP